jgi:hypothetical protein
MEPFPHHYSHRPRNDESSAAAVESSSRVDPSVHIFLDELLKVESRLDDRIEGHCSGLERLITEMEQRSEECFITLEMAHAESEQGRTVLEKQFDGLRAFGAAYEEGEGGGWGTGSEPLHGYRWRENGEQEG